ncbi:protein sidekick-2 [Trichechus manatus latirostris]|uniref:Protein sidekick-2 n=1 Tax=Trichechus manatus latirostris TaxID=127582 RepID=A0A2Y9QV33_TRIMA|nr:protein sidekick-2 [Trichechus manatus latirostris]
MSASLRPRICWDLEWGPPPRSGMTTAYVWNHPAPDLPILTTYEARGPGLFSSDPQLRAVVCAQPGLGTTAFQAEAAVRRLRRSMQDKGGGGREETCSPLSASCPSWLAPGTPLLASTHNDVSPYFKTEPVRTQVHLEGNRLVLTCMAEGSWPLEFKWLHNNRELTKFSLEYRYMITSLDRTHAGFYRCIVRNRMGALLQRQTEVQVAYMGNFEEGEKRQSVSHGEAAVIRAPRIASFPQPQVTWFRDGRKIPPSSRIAITLENTLVILSTVAPDAGRYYVQAVNDKNGDNKTSQPVTLAVENIAGPADPIAPSIIIPPKNTSVVVGTSEVTLECVANARPLIKLHIIWKKDGVVVSGGVSDYSRRLTIPNPTGSDAGYYECEAVLRSSSIPAVTRGAYLSVLEPPQFVKEPERHITAEMEKVVDIPCRAKDLLSLLTGIAPNITRGPLDSTVIDGMSVVLACETSGAPRPAITWQKGERILASGSVQLPRFTLLESGSLLISPTHISDAGTYACLATNSRGVDEASADLVVWARTRITKPPQDQSVIKGTQASMVCGVTHDPRVTIRNGHSSASPMRLDPCWGRDAPWTVLLASVDPEATSVMVKGLVPARSYQFRLCAVNDVGKGQFSKDTESSHKLESLWLWQSHQNGLLRGYIIRYCLAGLPVGYQFKNITDADVNNLLLEDLIIWTNYEIEVAAYNSAGLGVYSSKVTEWTLQGVPTVPPGNVHAEATNSTAIRFTWNAPSPQFINGINQGYKLIAWEPEQEEEVTMVTARPNFQDSIHVGFVSGLKKFTEYFTSVLCFTTPGDGPRSTPQLVRTHEDVPGPVGHLSFNEILDTSLKVSWQEPGEKNGILTGYRISWEEYNRTNTRVTHYLPNITLEYRVTGLTALTTYTIEVAAMTSKGQGQVSASTISSGVPPELPGAPTNLGISNIGPRSVTLQFRPGYDGKTSISRWLVEAQVGIVGEGEEWQLIHQLSNEPDARSMEVPDLNPFTYYSFRMRQVNIVGTSPPSQPSRKIQTLQAPPDMAPANVTLRTASETSLWLRWMPLPEMEYNGNPESVGYKIKYSQSDGHGKTLSHVVHDRVEREYTIEDLEEWTEYRVQVQAFNAIGSGPWSQMVLGRTRESVPSSGPTNVSALATTSSSMLVRWNEIPEADRNGLVLGYKVMYKEKDSDAHPRFWLVEGNSSRSAQLTGLGKYVLYEVQVLAFTRMGDGSPSHPPILERTLDDVPGPPMGILFPEVRTTSVRLIWQPPAAPNGIILAYQITHRLNTTTANTANVEVLAPSARQYTATGLKPEAVYLFRITAQTRKGWGEAAEALVVTTEKRARPQPPSKPVVQQEDVKARSVLLSWEPGSDGLSPVRYYTVQMRELPSGRWALHSASVSHNASSFVVDRLKPFTSYKFRVKATNDIGDSEFSEESESLTTLQAAPDEAPTILSVTPHTTTSVLIRWQPPAEDKINGILLGFRIRYRELLSDGLRGFTLRSVQNPGAKWAELTSMYSTRNLSRPSLTQYELDNLNKHRRYEIRMSVYNAVGEGPSSPPQEVFVGEAVPTAAPQNVAVHGATATQLDVTWEPPPLESQNGDIQGYKIYFWEAQRWNLTERVKTLFLAETSARLKNLTGYTAYVVSVAAFNAAGDGPRSTPTQGQTQQAAPSAPSSIKFSELTTTSVNVSWEAPQFPNGILEGYRLVYEPCTPVDGVSKIVTVDVKGNSPLWLKVKDLAEGMTYKFRIRAKTFTYGPEIEANVTTGPGEGAPGPPGVPIIVRYSSAIAIHWSSGDPGKGPITRYVLEARPSDEGLWDILIKDIPKEVTSYTFSMDILKPGVSYDFRVIAVNDYGFGTPSSPSQSVPDTSSRVMEDPSHMPRYPREPALLASSPTVLTLASGLRRPASSSQPRAAQCPRPLTWGSPPRPSPGSLHYSDEDVTKYNDLIPAESSSLTEKPSEISDSQGSDSEYEADPNHQKAHSFVNHYISDPTYYNSWRRQQKGISRAQAYSYTESDSGEPDHTTLANSNSTQQGSLFRPKASRTPTPQNPPNPPSQQSTLYRPPSSLAPGSRAPIAGFSSFV